MTSLIVRTAARGLAPLMVALSLYFLLRGHDAPGGGFIGALITGAAIVLQYLAGGTDRVRRFIPVPFNVLLGWGLLLATGFGVAGLLAGGDFLHGPVWSTRVPIAGELKVASSLVFDVGVYLVVVGVILAIVRYLGEEGR